MTDKWHDAFRETKVFDIKNTLERLILYMKVHILIKESKKKKEQFHLRLKVTCKVGTENLKIRKERRKRSHKEQHC